MDMPDSAPPMPDLDRVAEDEANLSVRDRRRHRYEGLAQYPLFVLGLGFVVGVLLVLDTQASSIGRTVGVVLCLLGWLGFAADYFIGLWLTNDRREYVRRNWLRLLPIIFPPLFMLMAVYVIKMITVGAKGKFGSRARLYVLYLTTLTIMLGSVMVTLFERAAPNATIKNFGDGLWWSMETVSTVGYGDYYPVTVRGKIVAVVLFINGVALLSVVTASLAGKVLGENSDKDEVTLNDLHAELAALRFAITQPAAEDPATSPGNSTGEKLD